MAVCEDGRVDVGRDCRWYQDCLGMHILRKRDVPEEKYMNVFMGYGPEDNHFAAELTYSKCTPNQSMESTYTENFKGYPGYLI